MGVDLPAANRGWRQPAVITAALISVAAGFAQFGPAAALADVATEFGQAPVDPEDVQQLALSGTMIGIGYAIIRLASLGSLVIAGSADHFGRRRVLLASCGIGLLLTALTALSPSYWAFVAIFALGRPFLSATNAVAGVTAAEYTDSKNRASAIVLIAIGYAVGTGLTLVTRYLGDLGFEGFGFRGLFGLALVPVLLLPLAARKLGETRYYKRLPAEERPAVLGRVPRPWVPRLLLLCLLTAAIGLITGPANTYVFIYGEQYLGLSLGALTLAGLSTGPLGLLGLLVGRLGADRVGRRVTSAFAMLVAGSGGILLYSGDEFALLAGYVLTIFGQAMYAAPAGSLDAELFLTSFRATVAGWLTFAGVVGASIGLFAFGILFDQIGPDMSAWVLFAPAALLGPLYFLLPETKGHELEDDVVVSADAQQEGPS
jgi:MFS family permease